MRTTLNHFVTPPCHQRATPSIPRYVGRYQTQEPVGFPDLDELMEWPGGQMEHFKLPEPGEGVLYLLLYRVRHSLSYHACGCGNFSRRHHQHRRILAVAVRIGAYGAVNRSIVLIMFTILCDWAFIFFIFQLFFFTFPLPSFGVSRR